MSDNIVDLIIDALWTGFQNDEQFCCDREMSVIDGYADYDNLRSVASTVAKAIQRNRIIETVEQLRAIVPPPDAQLGGSVLKGCSLSSMGGLYEHNSDGSWNDLDEPYENALRPEDVPLPAILIWESPADRLYQPVAGH